MHQETLKEEINDACIDCLLIHFNKRTTVERKLSTTTPGPRGPSIQSELLTSLDQRQLSGWKLCPSQQDRLTFMPQNGFAFHKHHTEARSQI